MNFDSTLADIWEEECRALMEMPEHDRLIGIQADDLLALIEAWRDNERNVDFLNYDLREMS